MNTPARSSDSPAVIDVLAGGRWLVRTSSGAQHLIDASDPASATVVRVQTDTSPGEGFVSEELRRDGEPVRVRLVQHRSPAGSGFEDGVRVGEDVWLVLEPLAADADATIRRTTPVVSVTELDSAGL